MKNAAHSDITIWAALDFNSSRRDFVDSIQVSHVNLQGRQGIRQTFISRQYVGKMEFPFTQSHFAITRPVVGGTNAR